MTTSAPPSLLSPPRLALVAFAQCPAPAQADIDAVMRALVSHDGWWVPVAHAERSWGQSQFERILTFDDAAPTQVLTVFTDEDCALLADGQPIGLYGGPVSGVRLMGSVGNGLASVSVNPASPREHQWVINSIGFDITLGWAATIAVERALADRHDGPVPVRELLAGRYHLLVDSSTRTVTQVQVPEVDGSSAVCFTATDRAEEFMRHLPAPVRPQADLAAFDGGQLFDTMRGLGAAAIVINAGSDDQAVLSRHDIAELAVRGGGW